MVDQKRHRIEQRFNRIVVFFYCLLIFFLPISIALVESMAGFVILFFAIKKIILCVYDLKMLRLQNPGLSLGRRALFILSIFKPSNCYLNIFMGLFIGLVFISVLQSRFVGLSLIAFIAKLLEGYFLYFSFVDCVTTKKYLKAFLTAYLASVTLMAVNGIVQYFTHTEFVRGTSLMNSRVSSSLRHANDFGAYLILVIPMVLGVILLPIQHFSLLFGQWVRRNSKTSWILKCGFFVLFLALLVCIGLTYSRGSWIGFWVSLAVFVAIWRRNYFRIFLIGIVFLVIFLPLLAQTREVSFVSDDVLQQKKIVEQYVNEYAQDDGETRTFSEIENRLKGHWQGMCSTFQHFRGQGRIGFWSEGLTLLKQRPILGSGLNTYSKLIPGYPHNCYLQMAVEIGILGLAAFLIMIFGLFWHAFTKFPSVADPFLRASLAGATAGLAGFLIQSFFDTTLYSVQLGTLMWVFMGLIVAVERLSRVAE